jgi:hypothetical protein
MCDAAFCIIVRTFGSGLVLRTEIMRRNQQRMATTTTTTLQGGGPWPCSLLPTVVVLNAERAK